MNNLQVCVEMGDNLEDERNFDQECEEHHDLKFNYYDDNPSFEDEVNQEDFEDLGWGLEPKITGSNN